MCDVIIERIVNSFNTMLPTSKPILKDRFANEVNEHANDYTGFWYIHGHTHIVYGIK
jgi:hypothetical protein